MTKHIFENTVEMKIVKMLESAGHEAYFVGGCVRDYIISGENSEFEFEDIDIATNASPEEAMTALSSEFQNFDLVGARFGVLMVTGVEIAQFRSETYEQGSKGKPEVQPAGSAYEDAIRRDFTMNSMYMSSTGEIVDFNNGKADIENKVIRAIGNPDERFKEDPSRILRLFYLAARFNFEIAEETLASVVRNKELVKQVPDALVGKITRKIISHNSLSVYLKKLERAGMYSVIYPEFKHTLNKHQNPVYHDSDVFHHTIRVIQAAESRFPCDEMLAMKAWTHDIAKGMEGVRGVNVSGQPNDLGHEEEGAPISKEFCQRLQFGREFATEIAFNTLFHGVRFTDKLKSRSAKRIGRKFAEHCTSKEQLMKRAHKLIEFIRCDAEGFTPALKFEIEEGLMVNEEFFFSELEKTPFFVAELPIRGDVVSAMFEDQKNRAKTGDVLRELLILEPESAERAKQLAEQAVRRKEQQINKERKTQK